MNDEILRGSTSEKNENLDFHFSKILSQGRFRHAAKKCWAWRTETLINQSHISQIFMCYATCTYEAINFIYCLFLWMLFFSLKQYN